MLRINYKTLLYFSTVRRARRARRAAAIGFTDTTIRRPPVFCQYKTRAKREFAPRAAPLVLLASALHRFLCGLQTAHCGGGTALLKSSIRFVKARHQLKPSAAFPCRVGRLLLVLQTQRYVALPCFANTKHASNESSRRESSRLFCCASALHRFLCSLQTATCGGGASLLKSSIRFVKARHRLEPSAAFPCRVGRLLLVLQTQRCAALPCFAFAKHASNESSRRESSRLFCCASALHRFLCSLQTATCGGGTSLLKSSIRFVKARHQLEPSAAFPSRGNNFCRPCRGCRVCRPS